MQRPAQKALPALLIPRRLPCEQGVQPGASLGSIYLNRPLFCHHPGLERPEPHTERETGRQEANQGRCGGSGR